MSQPSDQRKEHPSTYFVQDRSNDDERTRVHVQDLMLTKRMGGALPEQTDPTRFQRILDVGCGAGGWLIEAAKTYPDIKQLVGADVSTHIVKYARELAKAEHVDDRVEFQVMDALRMIEFPRHHFDLINQRLGMSYLRTWDWPNLFTKYMYAIRPGGVIRITEGNVVETSTSPALAQLFDLMFDALYSAGHYFTTDRKSIVKKLPEFFHNHGLKDVQTRSTLLEYRAGSEMMDKFYDDIRLGFRTMIPFLRKWSRVPDNYDDIYRQALEDIHNPDYVTTGELVTIWGTVKQ